MDIILFLLIGIEILTTQQQQQHTPMNCEQKKLVQKIT